MARLNSARIVVVGAGNAALTAALAAAERGAHVTVLEAADRGERGGNSWFTAGLVRVPHAGRDDVLGLVVDPPDPRTVEIPPYPAAEFGRDLERASDGRILPELASLLVDEARPTLEWLRACGARLQLSTGAGRQAFEVDGRLRFWGGACLEFAGGGIGHVDRMFALAERAGARVRYGCAAVDLLREDGRVTGVRVGTGEVLVADAVVLACGGFEASAELRAEHLGPEWRNVQVRGTAHNTGAGLDMALAAGAERAGDWRGCHAVAWDLNAPPTGDWRVRNAYQKHSYPFGLVLNAEGRRFVDEGADFRNHTYARYGAEILKQPGGVAYQLFDAKAAPLFRREYAIPEATRYEADRIEDLADRMGLPVDAVVETVRAYNAAVNDRPFDPTRLDGKAALGVHPPKSNWALPLDTPPFLGFPVRCGITFTFGGVRVDGRAAVLDRHGRPIPGLYAAGEMVGGLYWGNYPGGSGLMSGCVFGRRAGTSAALDGRSPTQC